MQYLDCIVGGIVYRHGDSIGHIGKTCTGEITYTGTESICNNGNVVRQPYNGECPSGLKCCQSGKPGTWGAAICISRPCNP